MERMEIFNKKIKFKKDKFGEIRCPIIKDQTQSKCVTVKKLVNANVRTAPAKTAL
jgi:hypothetical protein